MWRLSACALAHGIAEVLYVSHSDAPAELPWCYSLRALSGAHSIYVPEGLHSVNRGRLRPWIEEGVDDSGGGAELTDVHLAPGLSFGG
ncbi:MAG: hypothetical protein K2M11_09915 [Paramuribaculum sp.]|nr:hypothetical protein [Paramuribaculum sp.]